MRTTGGAALATAFAVACAGCGGNANVVAPVPLASHGPLTARAASANPIEHVVIVIQENRSFDNIFHRFAEPDGTKADTVDAGTRHDGSTLALARVAFEDVRGGPSHGHGDFRTSYDGGKMDGFDVANAADAAINYGYAYLPQAEVQPYWDMASQGALAERFFHGIKGSTFPSHMMLFTGTTNGIVGSPGVQLGWGCEDPIAGDRTSAVDANDVSVPGPYPCTDQLTIADLLERAGHTLQYYSGPVGISPGGNLNALAYSRQAFFGPDYAAQTVSPETRFLVDVAAGTLADVTYVVPEGENSDAAQGGISTGPQWVASVVNAVGTSAFYKNTAIFVTWDDWGGWYDHVKPPQYDAYGLGFRIPLIAISPYAKHGKLIETTYEPGSILKFVEETFGLPSLGTADARAASVADMFDFTQTPPPFTTIASSLAPSYFVMRPIDTSIVDPQ